MAIDLATIGVGFDTSGLTKGDEALRRVKTSADAAADASTRAGNQARDASGKFMKMGNDADQASKAMRGMASQGDMVAKALKGLTGIISGYQIGKFIGDSVMLAARFETMGVVMQVAGNNAGYTRKEMDALAASLQKSGISMQQSRNAVVQLATANIDLAKAHKLGRAAQDLAVIGNTNSSEAMARLIHGIKSGEVEILRTLGLNVSFEGSYKKLAAQLGTTSEKLTEQQKVMARTNAVTEEAAKFTDIYEAAMGTAGKQMSSMTRFVEDFKTKIGATFNEALIVLVGGFTQGLKDANGAVDDLAANRKLDEWGNNIAETFAFVADSGLAMVSVFQIAGATAAMLAAKVAAGGVGTPGSRQRSGADGRLAEINASYEADMQRFLGQTSQTRKALEDRRKALADAQTPEAQAKAQAAEKKRIDEGKAGREVAAAETAALNKKTEAAKAAEAASKKQRQEYESAVKSANSYIDNLREEANEIGLSSEQIKMMGAARAAAKAPTEALRKEIMASALAYTIAAAEEKKKNDEEKAAMEIAKERQAERRKEQEQIEDFMRTQKEARDATTKSAKDYLKELEFEISTMRMSNEQREIAVALHALENQGIKDGTEAWKEYGPAIKAALEQKSAITEHKRIWASIDETAHGVFTDMVNNGESAFKRLGATLKSALWDLLYQMTIKKWIVNLSASFSGTTGGGFGGIVSSIFGGGGTAAGGGGGIMSNLGSVASMFSGGGNMGFATMGGSLLGNSTVYGAMTPGLTMGSQQAAMLAAQTGEFGAAGLSSTMSSGATATGATSAMGSMATMAAGAAAIGVIAYAFMEMYKNNIGEKRSGGGYGYNAQSGAYDIAGPSGGDGAADANRTMVAASVASINAGLLAIGSAAKVSDYQAMYETSIQGRGGVFSGLTLSDGTRVGEDGTGSNYEWDLGPGNSKYETWGGIMGVQDLAGGGRVGPGIYGNIDMDGTPEELATDMQQTFLLAMKAGFGQVVNVVRREFDIPGYTLDGDAPREMEGSTGYTYDRNWDAATRDRLKAKNKKLAATGLFDEDPELLSKEQTETMTKAIAVLVTNVNGFTAIVSALPIERLKNASFDVKASLVELMGGLERAAEGFAAYSNLVYTDAEKRVMVVKNIQRTLASAGGTWNDDEIDKASVAQYRAAVEAAEANLDTEAGQRLYAALISVAPAFGTLVRATNEAGAAVEDLGQKIKDEFQSMFDALQRAVDARRSILEARLSATQQLRDELQIIFDILGENIRSILGEVGQGRNAQARQGRSFIANALTNARAGFMPDADDLSDAIGDVRASLVESSYTDRESLEYDKLRLATQLKEMKDITGPQLTAAEQEIANLEAQLKALDEIMDTARRQLDAIQGVDTSVLSVEEAVLRLTEAFLKANPSARPATGGGAGTVSGGAGSSGGLFSGVGGGGIGTAQADTALSQNIRTQLQALDWTDYESAFRAAQAISQAAGWSSGDVGAALGINPWDIRADSDRFGLPSFAVGTPYVPRDMIAKIHQGERVVTASENRSLANNSSSLVAELQILNKKVGEVHLATEATAVQTESINSKLQRVIEDDYINTKEKV